MKKLNEKELEENLILLILLLVAAKFNQWGFLYRLGIGLNVVMNELFVKMALFAGFASLVLWLKIMYSEINDLREKLFGIQQKFFGTALIGITILISLWNASIDLLARPSGKIGVAIAFFDY